MVGVPFKFHALGLMLLAASLPACQRPTTPAMNAPVSRVAFTCPGCGGLETVVPIHYGLPSVEGPEAPAKGCPCTVRPCVCRRPLYMLGGCIVYEELWTCYACRAKFASLGTRLGDAQCAMYVERLDSGCPNLRADAANNLAALGVGEAEVDARLRAACGDDCHGVVGAATSALLIRSRSRSDAVSAELWGSLADLLPNDSSAASSEIVDALYSFENEVPEALAARIAPLLSSDDAIARTAATRFFSRRIAWPAGVAPRLAQLCEDSDRQVRLAAQRAIAERTGG